MRIPTRPTSAVWLRAADCRLEDLRAVLDTHVDPADHPHAAEIVDEVPVYDGAALRAAWSADRAGPGASGAGIGAELVRALADGPGVVAVRGAVAAGAVARATAAFEAMIAEQRAADAVAGDHFAPPGANDRVWNALEKLAVTAPEVFVEYYAEPVLALVSQAWLGPGYQVTSQVNVVNPGGAAQVGHRDYPLGFLPQALAERFPAHVHRLSPALTLQGAVAHGDMPLESGPTMYLPHSQKYPAGYLAVHRPEFRAFFTEHHVQLPLRAGDAVFFNPALIHAAGHNRSAGVRRMANLLQVSSAFGRSMERVDRARVVTAVYPALRAAAARGTDVGPAVAAAAEGYAFPTDLDRDPPVDGLAPPSQADLVHAALAADHGPADLAATLAAWSARRGTL